MPWWSSLTPRLKVSKAITSNFRATLVVRATNIIRKLNIILKKEHVIMQQLKHVYYPCGLVVEISSPTKSPCRSRRQV